MPSNINFKPETATAQRLVTMILSCKANAQAVGNLDDFLSEASAIFKKNEDPFLDITDFNNWFVANPQPLEILDATEGMPYTLSQYQDAVVAKVTNAGDTVTDISLLAKAKLFTLSFLRDTEVPRWFANHIGLGIAGTFIIENNELDERSFSGLKFKGTLKAHGDLQTLSRTDIIWLGTYKNIINN